MSPLWIKDKLLEAAEKREKHLFKPTDLFMVKKELLLGLSE